MTTSRTAIHLLAGGAGGTAGAVVTCPLEVVKTRQQSSIAIFHPQVVVTRVYNIQPQQVASAQYTTCTTSASSNAAAATAVQKNATKPKPAGLMHCLKHIIRNEGPRGLFKGLGPNIVGVAPSRLGEHQRRKISLLKELGDVSITWESLLTSEDVCKFLMKETGSNT